MRFVKYLLLMLAMTVSLMVSAQSADQKAKAAFDSGNYSDAAQLYDMAATLSMDQAVKNRFYAAANKSRECASYKDKAVRALKAKNYESALSCYSRLVKLNPGDRDAASKVQNITETIERLKIEAQKAEELKIRKQSELSAAMSSSTVSLAEEYQKNYPDDRISKFLPDIWKTTHGGTDSGIFKDDMACVEAGDLLLEGGYVRYARTVYDIAASRLNHEALLKKASTYNLDNMSTVKDALPAIILAAESGYSPAKKLMARLGEKYAISYSQGNVLQFISAYRDSAHDMDAAMRVLANIQNYRFEHSMVSVHDLKARLFTGYEEASSAEKDKVSSYMYRLYLLTDNVDFLQIAAYTGSINAYIELAKREDINELAGLMENYRKMYEDNSLSYLHDYVRYLKGEEPLDWNNVMKGSWYCNNGLSGSDVFVRHDQLVALMHIYTENTLLDKLKAFVKLHNRMMWDEAIVGKCLSLTQDKKVLSVLGKLDTGAEVYDIKKNHTYALVAEELPLDHLYYEDIYMYTLRSEYRLPLDLKVSLK